MMFCELEQAKAISFGLTTQSRHVHVYLAGPGRKKSSYKYRKACTALMQIEMTDLIGCCTIYHT
jgi:hypothetical protein